MNHNMSDGQTPEGQTPAPAAPEGAKPEEEMTEEELNALHADEDFIANFSEEDKKDPEKVNQLNEALLRSAQTTIHQKRHYRGKVQELTKPAAPAAPAAPATPAEPAKPTAQDKQDEKKVDPNVATNFRLDHPELSKDQQLKVIAHAGAYGITPEEALEDPLMKSYIATTNTQEDVDGASPAPATPAGAGVADRDWSTATPEEIEAARNKILHGSV